MGNKQDLLDWISKTGLDNIIWATDLDLTLLDSQPDPDKVAAPPGLQEACAAIDVRTSGRFFVITGREMSYVDSIFPGASFKASCEYHNMFRLADGAVQELSARPQWTLVDEELAAIAADHPGMMIRKKPFMRSIHYSHAPSLKDDGVKSAVIGLLQKLLDKLENLTGQKIRNTDGGKIFDLGPDGLDKGQAYEAIITYAQSQVTDGRTLVPIYFGDSPGDLPAALVAKQHGGIFIAVGSDARLTSIADFVLDSPQECRDFITLLSGIDSKPEPGRDTSRKPGFEPS